MIPFNAIYAIDVGSRVCQSMNFAGCMLLQLPPVEASDTPSTLDMWIFQL